MSVSMASIGEKLFRKTKAVIYKCSSVSENLKQDLIRIANRILLTCCEKSVSKFAKTKTGYKWMDYYVGKLTQKKVKKRFD